MLLLLKIRPRLLIPHCLVDAVEMLDIVIMVMVENSILPTARQLHYATDFCIPRGMLISTSFSFFPSVSRLGSCNVLTTTGEEYYHVEETTVVCMSYQWSLDGGERRSADVSVDDCCVSEEDFNGLCIIYVESVENKIKRRAPVFGDGSVRSFGVPRLMMISPLNEFNVVSVFRHFSSVFIISHCSSFLPLDQPCFALLSLLSPV